MTRLAVLIPSLGGGGAERAVVNLLRGFVDRGIEVDLLIVRSGGPLTREVASEVRIVELRGGRIMTALPSLIGYLRKSRPDALLSHLDSANLIALWARRLAGVQMRVVVTTQVMLTRHCRAGSLRDRITAALVPYFYPWADAAVGVSEGVAADLAAMIRPGRVKVQVIHNPIVSDELLVRAGSRRAEDGRHFDAHVPLSLPEEKPFLLSIGRLARQKNQVLLIDAFALIARDDPNLRLVILGEGPERARLEHRIERSGLTGRVHMPGFVGDPAPYYRAASVFVLSSDWEGLPTVLIEALAFGCPIVSTRCPAGPDEILENGSYGRLVPMNDPAALAEAIKATLRDPLPATRLRERARHFSAERAVSRYLDVLFPGDRWIVRSSAESEEFDR